MRFNIVLGNNPSSGLNTVRDHTLIIQGGLQDAGHFAQLTYGTIFKDSINLFYDFLKPDSVEYFAKLKREGVQYALITTEIVKGDSLNYSTGDVIRARLNATREIAKDAQFVWVMHEPSLEDFKRLCGHDRCFYLPLGFSRNARELRFLPYEERDIDFLFFGHLNDYRKALLENLEKSGNYAVKWIYNVPGFIRNSMIERSKINLSLRQTDTWDQPSVGRISYLVTNRCAVVCDKTENGAPYENYATAVSSESLVRTCQELLASGGYQKDAEKFADAFEKDFQLGPVYSKLVQDSADSSTTRPTRPSLARESLQPGNRPSILEGGPALLGRELESIALFSPNASALHVNVLLGLRKAFAARNVRVHVGWNLLARSQLKQFCDVFRPDAVLEIDRTRNKAIGLPAEVISIAWVQDWRSVGVDQVGVSADNFGGSDLNYFCVKPEAVGINTSKLGHWGYLLQATDPSTYYPEPIPIESDFSLIGYIPPKDKLQGLDWHVKVNTPGHEMQGVSLGTVRDVIDALRREGLTWNQYDAAEARRAINRYLRSRFMASRPSLLLVRTWRFIIGLMSAAAASRAKAQAEDGQCLLADDMMYCIENEIMRLQARQQLVDDALKVSQSMRLFGVGEWQTYPEYRKLYKGPLENEADVRRVYRSTKLNLHNAMTQMHARVLDCMASGGAIMVNKMRHNTPSNPDCLRAHFEEGIHYLEYDDDDFEEQAKAALENEERRRRIADSANEVIRAKHTWDHRVDQIMHDLANR